MKPVPDVADAGVVVTTGTAVTVVGTPDGRPENVEGTCVIVFGTCVIVIGSGVVIVCGTGGIGSIRRDAYYVNRHRSCVDRHGSCCGV